jgi:hypothetical protein
VNWMIHSRRCQRCRNMIVSSKMSRIDLAKWEGKPSKQSYLSLLTTADLQLTSDVNPDVGKH